jgi:hypothetical protein
MDSNFDSSSEDDEAKTEELQLRISPNRWRKNISKGFWSKTDNSAKNFTDLEFRYSARRLIGSLWADIKAITITE